MSRALSIADWCILAAALLPLLFTGMAKFGEHARGFTNRAPRQFQAQLDGWRARAHWAHQNSMEAFPFFAVAVLLAEFRSAPRYLVDLLALAFIALRLIYGALYIADRASARSVAWALGFACCIGMFVIAV